MNVAAPPRSSGLLGDTSGRDYAVKLRLFNAFAEPELRAAISDLELAPGMKVLEAGCGTGEALAWLAGKVQPDGVAIGLDLSVAHTLAARGHAASRLLVVQGDLQHAPFPDAQFDLIWCVNAIHHLRDPLVGLHALARIARPGGRIVVGQSGLVPELLFAWDSRLERLTHEAVRAYYRHRYAVAEEDLAGVRAVVGLLRRAGLARVAVKTLLIERVSPLGFADEHYLLDAIFRGTWGECLRPYMPHADFEALRRVCDPAHPDFALGRPDFHYLQTLTFAIGHVP